MFCKKIGQVRLVERSLDGGESEMGGLFFHAGGVWKSIFEAILLEAYII